MAATTDVGFIAMRIAKVVGFGPPLAEEPFHCVVLDEVSGDRHLVISIGDAEAFSLAARLQGLEFGRPMTYDFAAALVRGLGGHVRQVRINRLVEGIYVATVEVEGPLGAQSVDARPSDALNLATITDAHVLAAPELVDDFEKRQDDDSAEAGVLRLALTVPHMRIMRATGRDLLPSRTWAVAPGPVRSQVSGHGEVSASDSHYPGPAAAPLMEASAAGQRYGAVLRVAAVTARGEPGRRGGCRVAG
jgi:bifunctional DNase/RNase